MEMKQRLFLLLGLFVLACTALLGLLYTPESLNIISTSFLMTKTTKVMRKFPSIEDDIYTQDLPSVDGIQPHEFPYYNDTSLGRLESKVNEWWYYRRTNVPKSNNSKALLRDDYSHYRRFKTWVRRVKDIIASDPSRKRVVNNLAVRIQNNLHRMQNPQNCSMVRKLVCDLFYGGNVGFSARFAQIAYCLIFGYATNRTVVFGEKKWVYSKGGWSDVFQPISQTCTTYDEKEIKPFANNSTAKVMVLPWPPYHGFQPPLIPQSVASEIGHLHGNPSAWWIGQVGRYIWRHSSSLKKRLDEYMKKSNFSQPLIGVHVRRTDKNVQDASYHAIEKYMKVVKQYFDEREWKQKLDKRRVYLATDDPGVLAEARNKYPNYVFLNDNEWMKDPLIPRLRRTKNALESIISDIHYLGHTDYLVCTFSSGVCKKAFEMMQTRFADASDRSYSLDIPFLHFPPRVTHQVVLQSHKARNAGEIDLKVGDIIKLIWYQYQVNKGAELVDNVLQNHNDIYARGINTQTGKKGFYPRYKVRQIWPSMDFLAEAVD